MWGNHRECWKLIGMKDKAIALHETIEKRKDEIIAILEDTIKIQQKTMDELVDKVDALRPVHSPPSKQDPVARPSSPRVAVDDMGRTLSQHPHPERWHYDHMAYR